MSIALPAIDSSSAPMPERSSYERRYTFQRTFKIGTRRRGVIFPCQNKYRHRLDAISAAHALHENSRLRESNLELAVQLLASTQCAKKLENSISSSITRQHATFNALDPTKAHVMLRISRIHWRIEQKEQEYAELERKLQLRVDEKSLLEDTFLGGLSAAEHKVIQLESALIEVGWEYALAKFHLKEVTNLASQYKRYKDMWLECLEEERTGRGDVIPREATTGYKLEQLSIAYTNLTLSNEALERDITAARETHQRDESIIEGQDSMLATIEKAVDVHLIPFRDGYRNQEEELRLVKEGLGAAKDRIDEQEDLLATFEKEAEDRGEDIVQLKGQIELQGIDLASTVDSLEYARQQIVEAQNDLEEQRQKAEQLELDLEFTQTQLDSANQRLDETLEDVEDLETDLEIVRSQVRESQTRESKTIQKLQVLRADTSRQLNDIHTESTERKRKISVLEDALFATNALTIKQREEAASLFNMLQARHAERSHALHSAEVHLAEAEVKLSLAEWRFGGLDIASLCIMAAILAMSSSIQVIMLVFCWVLALWVVSVGGS